MPIRILLLAVLLSGCSAPERSFVRDKDAAATDKAECLSKAMRAYAGTAPATTDLVTRTDGYRRCMANHGWLTQ